MMRRLMTAFVLCCAHVVYAELSEGRVQVIRGKDAGTFSAVMDGNALKISHEGSADEEFIAYTVFSQTWTTDAKGISFEVRAIGPDALCSVMVAESAVVTRGFEATFFTGSGVWETIEIPWADFVQNHKPWDKGATHKLFGSMEPSALTHLAFGRGNHMHTDYPGTWRFEIRNLKPLMIAPNRTVPPGPPDPFAKTRATLEKGEPLNILLLGDSITMQGKDQTYAHTIAENWKRRFGSDITVVNAGVGGHSVRGGRLVLKRSLRAMPDPDIVFVMYGANDSKAVPVGLTAEIFQQEIEALVDDLRRSVRSQPDVVLVNGVPRLNKAKTESSGIVEPIVPGIRAAAQSRNAVWVDTFSVYSRLSAGEIKRVYQDTVHPTRPDGHQFMGRTVMERLPLD